MSTTEEIIFDSEEMNTVNTDEVAGPSTDNKENKSPEKQRLLKLPLARVRHIMKTDPDVHIITQDAAFLTTKATELFITMLSKASFDCTHQTKRKTVMRQDFDKVLQTASNLCFLDGMMD